MALTGHLSDLSLSELIEFFCNQRKTGQLKVLYPQGPGHFYLQSGSVVDARVGVLRGIDAVYFALTLPNAKFEFSGALEATERTINQPWTQVVLEGLRRLDEGITPAQAFPPEYQKESEAQEQNQSELPYEELQDLRVPSFLSFMSGESFGRRKFVVAGAVAVVVIASVAAIGVPAGWYGRAKTVEAANQLAPPVSTETSTASAQPDVSQTETPVTEASEQSNDDAALAARRQREREKERAKAREERAASPLNPVTSSASLPTSAGSDSRPGPKRVAVTVTYDESGRVTQASGGDPTALRIARQKRFPAGKAGSATITIPIN